MGANQDRISQLLDEAERQALDQQAMADNSLEACFSELRAELKAQALNESELLALKKVLNLLRNQANVGGATHLYPREVKGICLDGIKTLDKIIKFDCIQSEDFNV